MKCIVPVREQGFKSESTFMGNIINLNRFRKQRQRDEKEKLAARNRVRYGRTKAERATNEKNEGIIRGRWERKRMDPEPTD